MDKKKKVILVDDHQLFREGIAFMLAANADYEIVGQGSSGPDALRLSADLNPDVILLDLMMPGGNGLDVISALTRERPALGILAVSSSRSESIVRDALSKGARGYVCKDDPFAEIGRAIEAVSGGLRYVSPSIADTIYSSWLETPTGQSGDSSDPFAKLSEREQSVSRMICEGVRPKVIASRLGISRKTVDTYKRTAMHKLGITTDAELIRVGIALGIETGKR
jgi:DNA-binding NarL/FixJ family response regulator